MCNLRKSFKYLTVFFIFSLLFICVSMVEAATFNTTGQGVQFGWDYRTPENGKTVSSNTGGAIYYPATINGARAFCVDYLKGAPSSGTTVNKVGELSTLQKAIIYVGMQRGSSEGIMAATQLAFWKASGGFDYSYIKQSGQYVKSGMKGMQSGTFSNMVDTAKSIYSEASKYSASDFSNSSSAKIEVNSSQLAKNIKGDYAYIGPIYVKSTTGSKVTAQILDNKGGLVLVGAIGATTSINTVPSNNIVFLKVPLTYGSGEQQIKFSTTSSVINGYMYSDGVSAHQRFGIIQTNEVTVSKKITLKWSFRGKITVVKTDDNNGARIAGAKFTLYDANKNAIQTKVTDSNGEIEFTELKYGTYYIKEISAPNGYIILSSGYQKIELENGDKTINVKNHMIKGKIKITKYVEYSGVFANKETVGSGDVKFAIYDSNGKKVGEISTDSNGVATSNYLTLGNYYLKEISVNNNYMKQNTKSVPFTITAENDNQTIDLGEFVNEGIMGSLQIFKFAVEAGKQIPIQGAVFEIYSGDNSSNAKLLKTITTNAAGIANVDGLQNGNYLYKEKSVPQGYKLDDSYKSFSITKNNKQIKVQVENQILYGKLNIVKKDEEKKQPIQGVVFDVYASNKTTKVATLTTDKNGKASVSLKYGTYYVKEVKAPSKVIMNTKEYKIIIGEGQNAKLEYTLDITNKLIDLGIKLYKVDNVQNPISGVRFALYTDAAGKNQIATATTNSSGLALFEKLKEGTYYYKELSAPDGYITTKISEMKPIVINYAKQPIYEETIVNEPILGQVQIHKIDEENNIIAGAEFDIKDSNGKIVDHLITDKNGSAISKKLRKGNYTLVETKVPTGYVLKKDPISFTINKDKEVVSKTIVNEYNKGKVKIKKVDSDTKKFIDGAVFEIYKIESNGSSKLVDTIRKYSSDGIGVSQELKNGKYYLIETVAPEGAILDSKKYEFEISDTNKVFEITVENKIKKGKIVLLKRDDLGNPISGVKFQILASNKSTVIEELVTDSTGTATSSRIKVGTYYVKETYTPELFMPLIDLIKVEIKNDEQVITLKDQIINKRITGGIKIVKKDDSGTPISGVEFTVYKEGSSSVVTKITTNELGIAMYTDLPLGKYYFVETKVSDNLYINSEKVSFEITQIGQLIEKNVVNQRVKGKLVINKINSENGTGIEGVTFEIYDKNKNSLGVIYTDIDGIASTENLKDKNGNVITLYAGTYYYAEIAAPSRFFFDTGVQSFTISKGNENVVVNVENIPFKLPQTGGFISTDGLIVLIVSIISTFGYVVGNIIINRRRFA